MIEEQNEDIQVQLDEAEESSEQIEIPSEEQEASPDSGGEDELDEAFSTRFFMASTKLSAVPPPTFT